MGVVPSCCLSSTPERVATSKRTMLSEGTTVSQLGCRLLQATTVAAKRIQVTSYIACITLNNTVFLHYIIPHN